MEAGEPPGVGQSWARWRVPGRGGRAHACLLARPTRINCCQRWSTSTGPFASLSLRGLQRGPLVDGRPEEGAWPLHQCALLFWGWWGPGVAPGMYQNRERPLREAEGAQDAAPGRT